MSTRDWRDTVLSPEESLATALRCLDATEMQIVLILDEDGILKGTLTDGDVRRALLHGSTLETPIAKHMKQDPITIADGTSSHEALDVLGRMAVRSAPVVDPDGHVLKLITLGEFVASKKRDTPAVIMAGGRGARLRPLTDNTPKPLVPIGGEPLIDITTRRLVAHGFHQIWVATHYRSDDIQDHLRDGQHLGAHIQYIREEIPRGTVGAVRDVPVDDLDTPILVCNSDNLHSIDFGALLDFHVSSDALATLAVAQHATDIPFGVVSIHDGRITDLQEKPRRLDWVASGVTVITQRALQLFPNDQALDVPSVISELLQQGLPAGAFKCHGYWSDVGSPDTLQRARSDHGGGIERLWPSE